MSCPYYCPTIDDAEEAYRAATRALIRVNTMDCLYNREVKRTNRIGVGMTGIHEFGWNMFGYSFRDLIDEEKARILVDVGAIQTSGGRGGRELLKNWVTVPHTNTTIKPRARFPNFCSDRGCSFAQYARVYSLGAVPQ